MAARLLFRKARTKSLNLLLSLPGRPHPDPGPFFSRAGPPPDPGPFLRRRRSSQAGIRNRPCYLPGMRVLAGDVGGTKTAIAIAEIGPGSLSLLRARTYPSAAFPGLEEIAADFLSDGGGRPVTAAFGVAGPVRGGRAKVTKLPWSLDERRLARRLRIRRVRLVNDFVAAALGILRLSP